LWPEAAQDIFDLLPQLNEISSNKKAQMSFLADKVLKVLNEQIKSLLMLKLIKKRLPYLKFMFKKIYILFSIYKYYVNISQL